MKNFLIYGSYGYTGNLIVEQAVKQGMKPLLAGRDENLLRAQAEKFGLEYRAFSIEDSSALDAALLEVDAVLHCAGPFVLTFRQMGEACLRTKRHYVDISGEIEGFEALALMDADAEVKLAGIMFLPGGGFDVVPSDCLSAYVASKIENATHLEIYIKGIDSGVSRGTARSGIENMQRQGRIRRDGKIISVPNVWDAKMIDFGRGKTRVISVGWGDVSTGYYSTGIPNITTYMGFPAAMVNSMRAMRFIGPLLYSRAARDFLKWLIGKTLPSGPSREQNEKGFSLLIAEVTNGKQTARAKLKTPEAYYLTALTSVEIMKRILDGNYKTGFQTPSKAYGADFILGFEGVKREDV